MPNAQELSDTHIMLRLREEQKGGSSHAIRIDITVEYRRGEQEFEHRRDEVRNIQNFFLQRKVLAFNERRRLHAKEWNLAGRGDPGYFP